VVLAIGGESDLDMVRLSAHILLLCCVCALGVCHPAQAEFFVEEPMGPSFSYVNDYTVQPGTRYEHDFPLNDMYTCDSDSDSTDPLLIPGVFGNTDLDAQDWIFDVNVGTGIGGPDQVKYKISEWSGGCVQFRSDVPQKDCLTKYFPSLDSVSDDATFNQHLFFGRTKVCVCVCVCWHGCAFSHLCDCSRYASHSHTILCTLKHAQATRGLAIMMTASPPVDDSNEKPQFLDFFDMHDLPDKFCYPAANATWGMQAEVKATHEVGASATVYAYVCVESTVYLSFPYIRTCIHTRLSWTGALSS
jgi:hypothetical protein